VAKINRLKYEVWTKHYKIWLISERKWGAFYGCNVK
jgi:hypothetical protein